MGRVLLPSPLPHQLAILKDPSRNKLVCCGRRWGKTLAGLIAVVEGHGPRAGALRGALDGATVWWVAPSFPIASMIWRYLKRALRDAWAEKNENERRIDLPGGGSVTVKSADNPDSLRGAGLDGVVLDEAAFMGKEAWPEGLRPALADRQGWALFLTTPCGKNWFFDLWLAAEHAPGWARWQRPTGDNPQVPAAELAAARAELGSWQYAAEFEAQFVSPGGGLFKPSWLEARWEAAQGGEYALPGGTCVARDDLVRFATVDLAVSTKTTADWTVVGVFGKAPDGRLLVLDIDRARREGPDLVPAIDAVRRRWGCASVWVERTGFQLAIVQEARRAGIPVRELPADRDKISRALPATAAFEGGRLLLPRAAAWLRELEAELLAFPDGAHDDQVDALAYAVAVVNARFDVGPFRFFH